MHQNRLSASTTGVAEAYLRHDASQGIFVNFVIVLMEEWGSAGPYF